MCSVIFVCVKRKRFFGHSQIYLSSYPNADTVLIATNTGYRDRTVRFFDLCKIRSGFYLLDNKWEPCENLPTFKMFPIKGILYPIPCNGQALYEDGMITAKFSDKSVRCTDIFGYAHVL